jgi:hypothetical protein
MSEPATYISFLVRLWREPGQETPAPPTDWHSEVECIQTGQRWTFTTLEELLDFLRRQAQELAAPGRLGENQ